MTTCPNCGFVFDSRQLGTGRHHKEEWEPGPNHEIIRRALEELKGPVTIRQIQAFLADKLQKAETPAQYEEWEHRGKRTGWAYHIVQSVVADWVGEGKVDMTPLPKSREFVYTLIDEVTTL